MVVNCDIEFENSQQSTYFAGQVIKGKVTLTTDKIKEVKEILLQIRGFAQTHWAQMVGNTRVVYKDYEEFINENINLTDLREGDQRIALEKGLQTYSFTCDIPKNCPSSFEARHGQIRYMARVILVRPWKFNHQFTKGFTVLKSLDLNQQSQLLVLSADRESEGIRLFGFMLSDPIKMRIHLQPTGFVSGQNIPVKIFIENNTTTHINKICVRLLMCVMCHGHLRLMSGNKSKEDVTIISELSTDDSVLPHMNKELHYLLPVPATPPTTTYSDSSIIQINYKIEVIAKKRGIFSINQSVSMPVTIGNIPLNLDKPNNLPETKLAEFSLENFSILPPIYQESPHLPRAKLTEGEKHDYGENEFTPKYPVYKTESLQKEKCDTDISKKS